MVAAVSNKVKNTLAEEVAEALCYSKARTSVQ